MCLQKILSTFSFSEILQTNATAKNIVIVVAGTDKGNKLTFHSDQVRLLLTPNSAAQWLRWPPGFESWWWLWLNVMLLVVVFVELVMVMG